jgi:hypothetical protein
MNKKVVGFQARSIANAEPRYLNARRGDFVDPKAECGRAAESWLYNSDFVQRGATVVLVEGAADALQATKKGGGVGVALLGMTLTIEKLAGLASKDPGRVLVALDNEPSAQRRAVSYVEAMLSWGIEAGRAEWKGGKDAADRSATLVARPATLTERIGGKYA